MKNLMQNKLKNKNRNKVLKLMGMSILCFAFLLVSMDAMSQARKPPSRGGGLPCLEPRLLCPLPQNDNFALYVELECGSSGGLNDVVVKGRTQPMLYEVRRNLDGSLSMVGEEAAYSTSNAGRYEYDPVPSQPVIDLEAKPDILYYDHLGYLQSLIEGLRREASNPNSVPEVKRNLESAVRALEQARNSGYMLDEYRLGAAFTPTSTGRLVSWTGEGGLILRGDSIEGRKYEFLDITGLECQGI